jgi:TolB-like protein/Tfp pilus assembly protein PilF
MTPEGPESCGWSAEQVTAVRAQLDRLTGSPVLQQSLRKQRLLRHIVEATLSGAADRLKGYTLGVEVFDRGVGFDPNIDPIVRVEMGRLRSKLIEFYSEQGATDRVLIELPKGAYAARIGFRAQDAVSGAERKRRSEDQDLAERPSLAVIPFANLSVGPEQEYFADGITEDLITDLSKLAGLSVISRHSSFFYKGANKRIEEIGVELGVRYILEGSVRRAGETLRITAQLVDARSGEHVWAQRFDRPVQDAFSVQDDVTQKIVAALAVSLTPLEAARIGHEGTASLEAHDSLLRGLQRFWIYSEAANREARALFERALEHDGDYAAAHAWLARSLLFDYAMSWADSTVETLELARRHAQTAVELDGLLPFAHAVRCWAELWAKNGPTAIEAGRRAVALDPNNADMRAFLSVSLSASGHGEESLRQIETAIALNPHPSPFNYWARGQCLMILGRRQEALADFKAGIRLRAAFLPNLLFATWVCVDLGRLKDAQRYRDAMLAITGDPRFRIRSIWLEAAWQRRYEDAMQRIGLAPIIAE